MTRRVAVLMGTRPEAIKLAPVIAALRDDATLATLVVNTGQHRELIDQVIRRFGICVDRDLAVMRPDQSLATLTGRLINAIDEVLMAAVPHMVLVQGDTTTVLAGGLAGFYRRIPVGHVEAGLRTGNLASPFPEEANRRLTTVLAALHFAPTDLAAANLLAEGVPSSRVVVTGNTVIDALRIEVASQQAPAIRDAITKRLAGVVGPGFVDRPMVLITGHRRENFGEGFRHICDAIATLARRHADTLLVYPVHLNPNVKRVAHQRLGALENVRLIPPQPYPEFVALLQRCRLVPAGADR